MDINKYLNRINYSGDLSLSHKVLKNLQQCHVLNVPFENLDIQYGNNIELDLDKIYQKVVEKGRGGFCYELNGLFCLLLNKLGFNTKMISARVYDSNTKSFGKEFDHMALIVNLNDVEYLVDVGFGEFAFEPLKLELNLIQSDPRGDFVLEEYNKGFFQVLIISGEKKSLQYLFSTMRRDLTEFSQMCNYHQTSPNSHFTQNRLISKPTVNGRITIYGNILKVTEEGEITKEIEFYPDEFAKKLFQWFGIREAGITN